MKNNIDLSVEDIFFNSCKDGSFNEVKKALQKYPYLLHHKSNDGWSSIIIASFWQRLNLVKFLIDNGANPNDQGRNGTSVLMYAKTKLLDHKNPNLSLLKLLIDAGAKINHKDNYEKDIFCYLDSKTKSSKIIASYLKCTLKNKS